MGTRHGRLAAGLTAAWEAEVVSSRILTTLADRLNDAPTRARVLVLAAFCRAHASRLLARLSSMGRGPMPVPPEPVSDGRAPEAVMEREAVMARRCAAHYAALTDQARARGDVSSAWVCELNRTEEEDRARELLQLVRGLRRAEGAVPLDAQTAG